jgi:Zn-dependent protease with chaperone function
VAQAPASIPVHEVQEQRSFGATQIFPAEVAANRRRAVVLCAWTAVIPAVLIGALVGVTVSVVAGAAALVVVGLLCGYGVWRVAPRVSMRRISAVPADEHDYPRYYNITEGLCATFGLRMPVLHVVVDPVPNACALGRDARASDLVVTTGLLHAVGPIELEGVIAHELAHVKRGDNGVSSVGITLASLFGGEATLRRCVGARACREYRADVVGASTVRYPRGLLDALRLMMGAPPPQAGSVFATPRFGGTRWVWIDPSVGHRLDEPVPGDLDATSVRAAALSEW